jgi:ribonucleotide reductase beta subunit family protein with ferritin-like domain
MAVAPSHPTDAITYEDLYARWERSNWRATEIDFSQDRIDWHDKLTAEQRASALWLYTLFFHGEDSVADNLSPFITAAPLEEQKYFLTTQQVDEARHAVFFNRFMHEVVGVGDGRLASGLSATSNQLTWGHRKVFSHLDRVAADLVKHPTRERLAGAVTLYHIVIEAALAQPGQHMIERYLSEFELLPGFSEGIRNVSLDEQRHIGFGVKLLADLLAQDRETTHAAIMGMLREVLPWTLAVPVPPNWNRRYTQCFNFEVEDLYEEGVRSILQKLRAMGLSDADLQTIGVPLDEPPEQVAQRAVKLLQANVLGPGGPVSSDPEVMELLFDSIRRQADPSGVPSGTVIQWEFSDAEPWFITLDGTTSASRGRAPKPDVTLRARFADWADVVAGRADPRVQVLRGRLRPRGSVRTLFKLRSVFQ